MPELPEVEVYRQGLDSLVTGKVINSVEVYWPRIVVWEPGLSDWTQRLEDQKIHSVDRRGKYLIFHLSQDHLISHLRMEGKYFFYHPGEEQYIDSQVSKHTHLKIHFTDSSQLHYNDVRKFGRFELVEQGGLEDFWLRKKLGVEPLSDAFLREDFLAGLAMSKRMIKPLLLSQELVAGLGNIYADEVLYRASVHPGRLANTLTPQEGEALYQAIVQVLSRAVALGGSTIRTYTNTLGEAGRYQDHHLVYGRAGEPCTRCGHPIEKIKLAQRGTHFCPNCQRLEG